MEFEPVFPIDVADLPPLQTDEVWLHRRTEDHAVEALSGWDMDKAVTDAVRSGQVRFARVHPIFRSSIVIPKAPKPAKGSPTKSIFNNPLLCEKTIEATYRIRVTCIQQDKTPAYFMATSFRVAPTVSITAGHCLKPNLNDTLVFKEICGCCANPNIPEYFEKGSLLRFGVSGLGGDITWGEQVSTKGLYSEGSDVAFLRHESHGKETFLLPCSPNHGSVDKHIVAVSFPDPESFLQKARRQLRTDEDSPIWNSYKPAMGLLIAQSIRDLARKMNIGEEQVLMAKDLTTQIHMQVKGELLQRLSATFGKFSNGNMVASIGSLVLENGNDNCVGTTISLLPGSSGAAICPMSLPGYFVGIHSGGSPGFDLNVATSTDCPQFSLEYMRQVLPRLPPASSTLWGDVDMAPFLQWMQQHRGFIYKDSPWLEALNVSNKKAGSSKRPRRG